MSNPSSQIAFEIPEPNSTSNLTISSSIPTQIKSVEAQSFPPKSLKAFIRPVDYSDEEEDSKGFEGKNLVVKESHIRGKTGMNMRRRTTLKEHKIVLVRRCGSKGT